MNKHRYYSKSLISNTLKQPVRIRQIKTKKCGSSRYRRVRIAGLDSVTFEIHLNVGIGNTKGQSHLNIITLIICIVAHVQLNGHPLTCCNRCLINMCCSIMMKMFGHIGICTRSRGCYTIFNRNDENNVNDFEPLLFYFSSFYGDMVAFINTARLNKAMFFSFQIFLTSMYHSLSTAFAGLLVKVLFL